MYQRNELKENFYKYEEEKLGDSCPCGLGQSRQRNFSHGGYGMGARKAATGHTTILPAAVSTMNGKREATDTGAT